MTEQARNNTNPLAQLWEAEQRDAIQSVTRRLRTGPSTDILQIDGLELRRMLRDEVRRQRQAFHVFTSLLLTPVPLGEPHEAPGPTASNTPDET